MLSADLHLWVIQFLSFLILIYVSLLYLLILDTLSFVLLLSCLLAKHNKPEECKSSDLHGRRLIFFQERTGPYFWVIGLLWRELPNYRIILKAAFIHFKLLKATFFSNYVSANFLIKLCCSQRWRMKRNRNARALNNFLLFARIHLELPWLAYLS